MSDLLPAANSVAEEEDTFAKGVCCLKKCPNKTDADKCIFFPTCKKFIHNPCARAILTKTEVEVWPPDDTLICSKRCYNKWKKHEDEKVNPKKKKAGTAKATWDDGSMKVLLDWLTTEENYTMYSGGTGNDGKTKAAFQKEIAAYINERVDGSSRTPKDVANKIQKLETQFRKASDWTNATGAGVESPGDVEKYVKKLCLYYYELEDVMGARPNAKPLATNEPSSGEEEDLDNKAAAPSAANISSLLQEDDSGNDSNNERDFGAEAEAEEQEEDNEEADGEDGVISLDGTTTPKANTATVTAAATVSALQSKRLILDDDTKNKEAKKPKAVGTKKPGRTKSDNDTDSLMRAMLEDPSYKETRAAALEKTNKEVELLSVQINSQKSDDLFKLLRQRAILEEENGYTKAELDKLMPIPKNA